MFMITSQCPQSGSPATPSTFCPVVEMGRQSSGNSPLVSAGLLVHAVVFIVVAVVFTVVAVVFTVIVVNLLFAAECMLTDV